MSTPLWRSPTLAWASIRQARRGCSTLYTTKGEGLGPSICRKIIIAHGGRLGVEKNITHGVTFTLALPLRPSVQLPGKN